MRFQVLADAQNIRLSLGNTRKAQGMNEAMAASGINYERLLCIETMDYVRYA